MPTFNRAQVLLAAGFGVVVAGCADDEVRSDLNSEGPPRVLAVTVPTEGNKVAPIYCPAQMEGPYGTEKIHSVCLDDETDELIEVAAVSNVTPDSWEVRVVFNELLDGDQVETIVPNTDPMAPLDQYGNPRNRGTFVETQPVVLRCGGMEIPYDGYYDPSGSFLTEPPGPALVVTLPDPVLVGDDFVPGSDFVASGTACELEVKDHIQDKGGDTILASTRGPFSFTLAPFQVRRTDPNDEAEGVALDVEPVVFFNAPIDMTTLIDTEGAPRVTLSSDAGEEVEVALSMPEDEPTAVVLTPAAPLEPGTVYSLSVSAGITDIRGSTLSIEEDPRVVAAFTTDDEGGPDAGPGVDAGPVDAAPIDGAPSDAAPVDGAPADAALIDAAPIDAGA